MKNQIIVVLLFCTHFAASAQQAAISGFVHYEVYFPSNMNDIVVTHTKFYFSAFESLNIDNVVKEGDNQANSQMRKTAQTKGMNFMLPYGDPIGARIYRNIRNKTVVVRKPFQAISEAFIVREQWVDIDWKIEDNKTKQIGNYTATRAKGSFRGRDYTVWFSYDIPVPFGPWKLHGLPGLILEAEDSEKMMRMYATEIQVPFDLGDVLQVPNAAKEISHKEEVYMQDNFAELLAQRINSRLPQGAKGKLTPRPNTDGRKYHPERSFEWEEEAAPGKKRKKRK